MDNPDLRRVILSYIIIDRCQVCNKYEKDLRYQDRKRVCFDCYENKFYWDYLKHYMVTRQLE